MMLYYLMKTGNIPFAKKEDLNKSRFNNKIELSEVKDLFKLFYGFFSFYQSESEYFDPQDTICLIEGCKNHENLWNSNFVFNMHDPFDNSNPGRLKKKDE